MKVKSHKEIKKTLIIKYQRSKIKMIQKGLYIGTWQSSVKRASLLRKKITHIIGISEEEEDEAA